VWGQLEDSWSKDTANRVNNLVAKKWFSYGSYYARYLTFVSPKKRRTLSRPIRHAYHIPFLLFLREHAEDIHTNPNFSLIDAIQINLGRWDRPVPDGWVRRQLSRGKCLILLDGLDEVADATRREEGGRAMGAGADEEIRPQSFPET
jgi:hypothetical protein